MTSTNQTIKKTTKRWLLAAALVCGASVFIACTSNDDNETAPPPLSDVWDDATQTLTVNSNPGKNAYKGRTDIMSVVISDAVTSIADSAFYDCHFCAVDLPASVVSIGNEAFAGKDSELEMVTLHATNCTLGEHPFLQSIMTNIYVPAEAVATYAATYPYYKSQIRAIPEAQQTGKAMVWSGDLCQYIREEIPDGTNGKKLTVHNTQGGITVTFTGTEEGSGFSSSGITLVQGEKLTFTSTVGNLSQITIPAECDDEDEDDEPCLPVAKGWTWDAGESTFTWQGTPSATIEMMAGEDFHLEINQISFTIE